ncbi:alanine racemase [Paenibacillus sp. UNCCL117]|uniref:alanine racemase n=1 Tax=unclassified Paenibacillus TaxID=185978 RepID=UPI00088496C8|nr:MULTISPECIES: alanine racemase [unclassified Paenibacillus]SDE67458.1 alanine racemase [Paenibacillus sp. cl123]SFW70726.1 alanine racemase [Paenibacillus sp. UNCCL117]
MTLYRDYPSHRSCRYRDTWAEVSLDAIAHNVRLFKNNLKQAARFMAVVKADGYGHGAAEAAFMALEAGADYLGVAFVDEAVQLRHAGVQAPILILGCTPPHAVEAAIRQRLTITVSSRDMLDDVTRCAKTIGLQAIVHLKIDTGMSRLGFAPEEALSVCLASASPLVAIEGIFTHFADADNSDPAFTREQYGAFVSLLERLSESGVHIPIKHCCNSAAAMKFPDMHMDMVRIGIAMYGLTPLPGEPHPAYPLREAMQLKTNISYVKPVHKNKPVSYGLTYRTDKDSLVATLPIGYADGLSRRLSNNGFALVRGRRVPIIGRVCMDQTMIDVTSFPGLKAGEEATLFGASEGDRISIHEIAARMGTIPYEVVCLIGKRVPREYVRHGELVAATNLLLE